jgi:hypothetical protein
MINISRNSVPTLLPMVMAVLMGWPGESSARYQFGDLEISGEYFMLADFRVGGTPDQARQFELAVAPGLFLDPGDFGAPSQREEYRPVNAFRQELNLEFNYTGFNKITPVVKTRFFYDAMFDFNAISDEASRPWDTNLRSDLGEDIDPVIREAYLDIDLRPLHVRAGRQIATWGRSDGVTVLDVINPRNFRNPLTFEQERFMIPQDMLNMKFDLSHVDWLPGGVTKELQVIWNWDYTPHAFPGFTQAEEGQHPYTLAVVDYADQIINASEGLFGNDFFDNQWDDGNAFDKSEVFVRWRARTGSDLGWLSDMTYSFHYAHLFDDLPQYDLQNRVNFGGAVNIAGPRAGFGGGIDFVRHRYNMAGFSFDKALNWLPGQLKGTVLRFEMAYNMGNRFYEPDLALHQADQIQTLVGLDQYIYIGPKSFVKTPWFVSAQWWRDEILRDPGPGVNTNLGSLACTVQPRCGQEGYLIGGATTFFDGQRDEVRDVFTLFMFNDFLPGKTLHVELFALHELGAKQAATWGRALVGYSFNRAVSARVGANIVTGRTDSFFGQFERNRSIFTELKITF